MSTRVNSSAFPLVEAGVRSFGKIFGSLLGVLALALHFVGTCTMPLLFWGRESRAPVRCETLGGMTSGALILAVWFFVSPPHRFDLLPLWAGVVAGLSMGLVVGALFGTIIQRVDGIIEDGFRDSNY